MYVCMDSKWTGNGNDMTPKQELSAHARRVINRLDRKWRNVSAEQ